ncbi:cyanophycinase [Romeria aff. gracilis LEGE 07310]|uniref:Cyanophycinase n=1 Tax=Vasconcelosia minhoensis LEGE 07310 TaxID=915328 RepID=A0A8J7ACP5_9CYAN|nr:cyanophycinase [Romeria aff. gracilis LEGE 07310]
MQQSETLLIEERMTPVKNPSVLVIGGAEDKVQGREILSAFFERSGGSQAHIAIIPCASREPEATAERYRRIFYDMGAAAIDVLDIRERSQGEDADWEKQIDHCTGVFMTGGDQLRLCGLVADTPLIEQIRRRAQLGDLTLAGTSAGAAAMGEYMIAGGGSGESPNRALVDMSTGLGIIPEVVVDQHFHNRNRMARLISAIAIQPDRIGIGIDEDTCALFTGDGCFSVLGKGAVTVIDSSQMTYTNQPIVSATDPVSVHNLKVHIMVHGDRYDLRHHRIAAPMG